MLHLNPRATAIAFFLTISSLLAGCLATPGQTSEAGAASTSTTTASGAPAFGNPSPTASSSTSDKANAAADAAAYKDIEYSKKNIKGPALIVIPGEIKSNNATFTQKFSSNNIADFAELELSNANFAVLERANLGNLLNEISLAYNFGNPAAARKSMQVGKLKTTKWVMKFDILKVEQIAENKTGFDGRAVGGLISQLSGGSTAGNVAGSIVGTANTGEATGVWLIGMRYKIMNANTTDQVAQGYKELKMEVGAKATSWMGFSQSGKGGVGLDTMVQRLVQTVVWDIDSKYKDDAPAAKAAPAKVKPAPSPTSK